MKTLIRTGIAILAIIMGMGLIACSEDEERVSEIRIAEGAALEVFVNSTGSLNLKYEPSYLEAPVCTWTSDNEEVVEINAFTGEYTAKNVGKAIVTVNAQDLQLSAQCEINVNPIELKQLSLNYTEKAMLIGEELELKVSFEPEDATYKEVTWTSSDEQIATVDETGTVKAVKDGNCVITVGTKDGKCKAECNITVNPINVEKILLSCTEKEVFVGDEFAITASFEPENATYKEVTWTSSDEQIARVDELGRIKAVKEGNCVITVTTKDGKCKAECKLSVKPIVVEDIILSCTEKEIEKEETFLLKATVVPGNATYRELIWSTSDPNIAKVENGQIVGVNEGTCTITVTDINHRAKAECKIKVNPISVKGVYLDRSYVEILVGESQDIYWQVEPANAENQAVKVEIADESVASISEDGRITGLKVGSTTLTVTTLEGNYSATCQINIVDITSMVSSFFGSSSTVSINGYIRGQIDCYIQNLSSKDITLKSIQLIEGDTGYGRNVMDLDNTVVQGGGTVGYTITIKLDIYQPIFRWTYEYEGQEYILDKQYSSSSFSSTKNLPTKAHIECE